MFRATVALMVLSFWLPTFLVPSWTNPSVLGQAPTSEAIDRKIIEEAKTGSELMANLRYLSDVI
ncbi:MAG: hypothetical protein NZO58_10155, partial [Gemmataceae bacterium]|nr:hypothetical protein [Gemmataceae bacterium]